MNIACVLPAFNVQDSIGDVVLRAAHFVSRVLVIDDGSSDRTRVLAHQHGAEVLALLQNRGKGIALRIGLQEALRTGADFIVTLDAHGENLPEDIPCLLGPLFNGQAQVALGTRTRTHSSLIVGFKTTKLLLHELLEIDLEDAMSGVRAYTASAAKRLLPSLHSCGFGIDLEIALLLVLLKIPFVEVPVSGEFLESHEGFRPTHVEAFLENILWFSKVAGSKLDGGAADMLQAVRRRDSFRLQVGRRTQEFHFNPRTQFYE